MPGWNGEYIGAEEVKAALEGVGWEITGGDNLKGFDAMLLFPR